MANIRNRVGIIAFELALLPKVLLNNSDEELELNRACSELEEETTGSWELEELEESITACEELEASRELEEELEARTIEL